MPRPPKDTPGWSEDAERFLRAMAARSGHADDEAYLDKVRRAAQSMLAHPELHDPLWVHEQRLGNIPSSERSAAVLAEAYGHVQGIEDLEDFPALSALGQELWELAAVVERWLPRDGRADGAGEGDDDGDESDDGTDETSRLAAALAALRGFCAEIQDADVDDAGERVLPESIEDVRRARDAFLEAVERS